MNNACWMEMILLVDSLVDVHYQYDVKADSLSAILQCISQGIFSDDRQVFKQSTAKTFSVSECV